MPKKTLNPWLVAAGVLLLWLVINLISAHLRSDCGLPAVLGASNCADDIRRAGFPWVFWEEGGFAFRQYFSWGALFADLGLAVLTSVLAGWLVRRTLSSR